MISGESKATSLMCAWSLPSSSPRFIGNLLNHHEDLSLVLNNEQLETSKFKTIKKLQDSSWMKSLLSWIYKSYCNSVTVKLTFSHLLQSYKKLCLLQKLQS